MKGQLAVLNNPTIQLFVVIALGIFLIAGFIQPQATFLPPINFDQGESFPKIFSDDCFDIAGRSGQLYEFNVATDTNLEETNIIRWTITQTVTNFPASNIGGTTGTGTLERIDANTIKASSVVFVQGGGDAMNQCVVTFDLELIPVATITTTTTTTVPVSFEPVTCPTGFVVENNVCVRAEELTLLDIIFNFVSNLINNIRGVFR